MFDNGWVPLQHLAGLRGAGEGDDILAIEMIEQVARASADELECAFGQDAGFDDLTDRGFGEVGGGAGGLHDGRHAGQEIHRDFFQHTPHGEVKGVDMNSHAFERYTDMVSGKRSVLRDLSS